MWQFSVSIPNNWVCAFILELDSSTKHLVQCVQFVLFVGHYMVLNISLFPAHLATWEAEKVTEQIQVY